MKKLLFFTFLVTLTVLSNAQTVTDIDGNVYNTVTIGTQTWMAENLRVTKYRNGDFIGTTNPSTLDIIPEHYPKYQWAAFNSNDSVNTYGRLYTWYALTDSRGVCPSGWHLPSNADWTILTAYLGGDSLAANKLKETGTAHWPTPNTGASNESGFTALPSGERYPQGDFFLILYRGIWWGSTEVVENGQPGLLTRVLLSNDSIVHTWHMSPDGGLSVRCLMGEIAELPIVTTTSVTSITPFSASCECNITNEGGAIVQFKGVCWSSEVEPTIPNGYATNDGGGDGNFVSNITGLSPNTVYYVRAYAFTSAGVIYGNIITFNTVNEHTYISSLNLKEAFIYPNPATEKFYLNKKNLNLLIKIYDLHGNLVFNKKMDSNSIDISNLNNGIYIVKIVDSGKIMIIKLIKE